MGGTAATQVIQGERQFDLVVRMQEQYRSNADAIRKLLIATPDGQYLPLGQFCEIKEESGAAFIYREGNSRYIGVQFSVEGRDLASAVGEARKKVDDAVKLPIGYKFDWGGEYKEYLASQEQMKVIGPLTVLLILMILFALYGNLKFPLIIFFSVLVTEPVGGLLALYLTHTNFSVSSMLGFVALMGVAVQTSVILYSFINKLRLEGQGHCDGDAGSVGAAAAPHHDDGAGGLLRAAAGGDVHRNRQRFAEAVRHRDRRRAGFAAAALDFPFAGALRAGGAGRRHVTGMRRPMRFFSSLFCWLRAMAVKRASAQTALTWEQVKQQVHRRQPTLMAGQINIDESKAEEITAYLASESELHASAPIRFSPSDRQSLPAFHLRVSRRSSFDYLHERQHKRELRLQSQKDATAIAVSQQADQERNLLFNLRTAFVQTLQAKAQLALAMENRDYFDKEYAISQERYRAGDMAQVDLQRIHLQRVQYEQDYETALVNAADGENHDADAAQRAHAHRPIRRDGPLRFRREPAAAGPVPRHRAGGTARSARGDADCGSRPRPITNWRWPTARPIRHSVWTSAAIRRSRFISA